MWDDRILAFGMDSKHAQSMQGRMAHIMHDRRWIASSGSIAEMKMFTKLAKPWQQTNV